MENLFKKPLFWVVIIAVALIALVINTFEGSDFTMEEEDVAIRVNSVTYTFDEFDEVVGQVTQELEMYGMEVTPSDAEEQAIERIIQEALLMEHAEEMDVEVSQKEIDDYFQEVIQTSGMESEEEFMSQLEAQGVGSREEVDELLDVEIKMNKLTEIYSEDIEVEDAEIEELYENYVQQMEAQGGAEEIPTYEEMEEDLRKGMVQEEVYSLLLEKVEEMREDADIEINVDVQEEEDDEAPVIEDDVQVEPGAIEVETE